MGFWAWQKREAKTKKNEMGSKSGNHIFWSKGGVMNSLEGQVEAHEHSWPESLNFYAVLIAWTGILKKVVKQQ